MSYVVCDVEADGPCPGLYSIVCFGAVIVEPSLSKTFYAELAPLPEASWNPDALAVSGFSREQHKTFGSQSKAMDDFSKWLNENSIGQPIFISDNPAFDWQFLNFYFWKYLNNNPFGFSGRRIGDLYCGLVKDLRANKEWKKFRKTKHSHNPVDDCLGNTEALLEIGKRYNLRFY